MGRGNHKPRGGSLQFWPRKRTKRIYPRIRSWVKQDALKLLGFAGYKVGMTQAIIIDNIPNSLTKGMQVSYPITVIECPPLKPFSLRLYKNTPYGLKLVTEIFTPKFDKELSRKLSLPKKNKEKQVIEKIDTKDMCLEQGGQWNENIKAMGAPEAVPIIRGENGEVVNPGYCDLYFTCNQEYRSALEKYERNVFMTLIALGVISIIIGFMMSTQTVISVAFSLGGVLTFIVASARYWQFASEYLQVGILGLALLVLIWLGIKKFK